MTTILSLQEMTVEGAPEAGVADSVSSESAKCSSASLSLCR